MITMFGQDVRSKVVKKLCISVESFPAELRVYLQLMIHETVCEIICFACIISHPVGQCCVIFLVRTNKIFVMLLFQ